MNSEEFTHMLSTTMKRGNQAYRHIGSFDETLHTIVTISTKLFGMSASYVSRILHDKQLFEIVAFHSNNPEVFINTGSTYQRKSANYDSEAEATPPVVIENTFNDPTFQYTTAHDLCNNVGCYVEVPIILGKDVLYGALCVVDTQPHTITTDQTELYVLMGKLLATEIVHTNVIHNLTQTEHALRKNETLYNTFTEQSPDMIIIIVDRIVRYINLAGARMLDFDAPYDVVGHSINEYIDADELHRVEMLITPKTFYSKTIHNTEVYLKSRTNRQLVVEINGFRGNLFGTFGFKFVGRDITHRKRQETELSRTHQEQQTEYQDLSQLNEAKSLFVSIVSHEFRTALTGIQGFSEMMHTEDFTIEEMREFAKDINEDAKRLNRMITEMLDLDRMESGTMVLYRQSTDINELITHVVNQETRINQYSHQFHVVQTNELPHISVDRDKLIQVITNLISNAVKYSPSGGVITIKSTANNTTVQFSVSDQGMGLTPEAIVHIFERYQRVDSNATRHITGTGLGLPITRQIIDMHHGRIWVESTPKQGSTFYVELPIVTDNAL